MTIQYVQGDATRPVGAGMKLLIHCCNDIGAWGAGFVLALDKQWYKPRAAYLDWANGRSKSLYPPFELGQIQSVQVESDLHVINMIGQHGVGSDKNGVAPIRYAAIADCLERVALLAAVSPGVFTVHCPRFGAGLAGGDWATIEALLDRELVDVGFQVTVYDLEPIK